MSINLQTRILVVDEFAAIRKIIADLLKQLGFSAIDEAADGPQALEKLKTHAYGLILCDCDIAPMSALDVLKAVRANPVTAHIPMIMITGESKMEAVMEARYAGLNGHIIKPLTAITLKEKLAGVLEQF